MVSRSASSRSADHERATRERSLNRRTVLNAAVVLTRREGLWALSVRRLARELGVWPTAVQYHIESKERLIELIVEKVGGEVARPPAHGPWQERLRMYAHAVREALAAYPGIAEFLLTRGPAGPNGLRLAEVCLAILEDAGLSERDVMLAYVELNYLLIGAVHREQARSNPNSPETDVERRRRATADALRGIPPDALPRMHRAMPALQRLDADELFNWTLDLLIDALASRASAHT
jgi:AcrR family transcriptional regulator